VIEIGLAHDLEYCAGVDQSMLVPRVGDRVRVLAS
jgi:phosphosulfolactate phosphohydrolase-like enzyme